MTRRRDATRRVASKSTWAQRTAQSKEEDRKLVAGLVARDEAAFRRLVERFADPLYRVVVGIVGNDAAEEVVSDVFLQVFRKIHLFRGDAAFSSWIYRVAINAARMHLRERQRRRAHFPTYDYPIDEEGHMRHIPDWSRLPEKAFEAREVRERIERAVAKLPEIYRTPFHLAEVLEWPREEVCKALKITPATLKSRIHRARLHLRRELDDLFEAISERGPR